MNVLLNRLRLNIKPECGCTLTPTDLGYPVPAGFFRKPCSPSAIPRISITLSNSF